MQYRRNDLNLVRGTFRVRGDTLEFVGGRRGAGAPHRVLRRRDRGDQRRQPAHRRVRRVEGRAQDLPGQALHHARREAAPRRHRDRRRARGAAEAVPGARASCSKRSGSSSARATTSTCCARSATATASRTTRAPLSGREPGSQPWCLLDFFPKDDWLLLVDESHVTLPQVHGMYGGDRSRKLELVEARLPAAVGARQPAADLRRVRPSRQAGRSTSRRRRRRTRWGARRRSSR